MNRDVMWATQTSSHSFCGISRQPEAAKQLTTYKALLELAHRPYWNRAWVMQEIAVAHKTIWVVCGRDCVQYFLLVTDYLLAASFCCDDSFLEAINRVEDSSTAT